MSFILNAIHVSCLTAKISRTGKGTQSALHCGAKAQLRSNYEVARSETAH